MMTKKQCKQCGRSANTFVLINGVCSVCEPLPVVQKHVDGIVPPKLVRVVQVEEAKAEAEAFVKEHKAPALKKKVAKKAVVKKAAVKKVAPAPKKK